jgi:tripartite ATP-independent transporter DctM subunit
LSGYAAGLLAVFFATGVPIAFAMLAAALVWFVAGASYPLPVYAQRVISGVESVPLLAIPFFILAGGLMNASGMTDRLLRFAAALVGSWTGGLGQVNVLMSMFMGGISGSATADLANDCKTLVPAMERRGYPKEFSIALSMSSATITAVLPPSIGLIIYAFITNTSVGRLFLAGVVPGLIMTAAMMVLVAVVARQQGYQRHTTPFSRSEFVAASRAGWMALLLPLVIIGGIRFGVFSATEAGVVAAAYAFFIGVIVYRTIKIRELPEILITAATQTAIVLFIIAAAQPLGWLFGLDQIPEKLAEALTAAVGSNPVLLLLTINVLLIVLGAAIDPSPLMLLIVPVLLPAVVAAGVDPVHFGIIVNLNLLIGAMSPPEGGLLFTAMAITKVRMGPLSRALIPFFLLLIGLLLLFTLVPALSLALPNAVFGEL